MTKITTTISESGSTSDGVNFETVNYDCTISYHYDDVVAEWDNKVYTIDEIRKVLSHMEYVEQCKEGD